MRTVSIPGLMNLEQACTARERLRSEGRRLVLTNGCFDLMHPGHVYFLRGAAKLGDVLWVCLNGDASVKKLKGDLRPVLGERERALVLTALGFVDAALIFTTPRLTAEIEALAPDVYAKAGDYTIETLNPDERAALEKVGADIRFLPFLEGFSTTGLIKRISRAADTF